jgi:LuxR family maltose regulon positive regulatory protein
VHRARSSAAADQEPGRAPADPLLATKLAIPPARPTLVPRPRLIARLQAGLQGPLTLLSAPAGSGKTTLLSAWRKSPQGRDLPLAWVSLDVDDNDPPRFWRYVLTALDRAAPGVGTAALSLLRSTDAPAMEAVLSALVNGVAAHAADIVLVLDDYHLIEAEPIHRLLAFLVEHLPPCLHLLLATRADPPLPLARLRARGDVTELRAADLRFTAEEAAAFLGTVMGLSLTPAEVAALEARTEGWIAGLQLAGLSLQGRPPAEAATFITAFTGSHRYIVDYLVDEVLLRHPEHVQLFLLHTCILDRLCAPLCAAVLEGENPPAASIAASQEVLETLERNNVFLIALDDERRWYRYHYLFADALRQRQIGHAALPDVSVLHRRASTWFAQQGLLDEAIGHALAGGCYDQAADLIGRAARRLASRGETQTLSTWLRALPAATLRARPQLAIMYAWLLVDMRDLGGAEEYLEHAEAALDTTPRGYPADDIDNIRAMVSAGRAVISVMQGDAARAIPQAQAALDDLDDTNLRARSLAGIALGLAHLSQGAASKAAEAFRGVAAVNQETNLSLFMVLAGVGEASAHRMAGALGAARATYEQAIAWGVQRPEPSLLVGSLYTGLADVLRARNELDAALDRATGGIQLAHDLGAVGAERWIEWHICNLLVLARIKQAQGDLDGALVLVQEAQEQLQGFGAISFAAILAAFEAQLHVARGDLDAAIRWLQSMAVHEAPPRFGLTPQFFVYASEHLEIAPIQVLFAQGYATRDPTPVRRALTLLDQLREKAERTDLTWLRVKTLTLQALAQHMLGETAPAVAALERALALAEPEGCVRVIVDEGRPMAALLRQLHAHGTASGYATALLAALESHPQRDIQKATRPHGGESLRLPLTEPLTERELDVLRLLAAGQSNPQIARALYVEVNTVKTHVKSLYGKLGVHSRVQAVRRARELGLL